MVIGMSNIVIDCAHPDESRKYIWEIESFSKLYSIRYQYFVCSLCLKKEYSGTYEFIKTSEIDIPSVAKSLKARHTKDGYGFSFKQFVRWLYNRGDEEANIWLKLKKR
jgi:hypothetical protein